MEMGFRKLSTFNIKDDCFLSLDITHVGVLDSFGRMHWSSKKEVIKAKDLFKKDLKKKAL
jgi:hypothetical protein